MLTERQLLILHAIVDDYVRSAEPVGSRSISKRDDISFSSATIRNDMADLEELGFLEKPHSSAGRIPSQKGYRYYVDHLLMPQHLTKLEKEGIRSLFSDRMQEVEDVIQLSARILSNMTSYISIVLGPEVFETKLRNIQIIPLTDISAILILVTDTGHVENQTIVIPPNMAGEDIQIIVNILNDRLVGVPLYQLRNKLKTEIAGVMMRHVQNYQQMLGAIGESLELEKHEKVIYSGKMNLLNQPEFRDIDKVRVLFEMLEQDNIMNQVLRANDVGVQVKIGHENKHEAFDNISMITASYEVAGKHMGTIGIIGPTRMEYRRVIGVVDTISKDLTKILTKLHR
ncbi:HrcA family transcriptional regulator [Alkalihalobacillus alcalophilus ATCC 27647 = CGMCC 1.3604]|uniref:Heat-inducible transcription repressor HrcA n=1 Tax=Alkalihalobacillus alcalophilus ATCC 27647 = CGMCC 1.3604 TaxID=1218173 RepID=A0A094WL26_ALKAL|nr:heat-inducible transcriptional repressor HrcA [Alkalihalobacillus alcalophilus]KGA98454.1 HrcA family transcriptional regulator [Alkalihalobacillus alcalophilus ATCC 27647 = CGMCC 1.3604]MED1563336.1 heat-inducible transcriptional repressor HrcA [Alkalihalobacillus alcalophilus]THG88524.1 HrcA family transcriptional regulator [Alkalihalobacillus alcalophilus ATCC 27647 = CGMCC 1.3604]